MSGRKTRSMSAAEETRKAVKASPVGHFGLDVTAQVTAAMQQGGSLDEETRRKMTGDISRHRVSGKELEELMPGQVAAHIEKLRDSKSTFSQADRRVKPRDGGKYEGYMLTATRVSSAQFDAPLKDVPRPLSPARESGTGRYHAAHTAPFSLGGHETNLAKTVNAPSWANVTVDAHIEKKAKEDAATSEVFHFRVDTHDRSTVGAIKRKKEAWEVTSAQYQRALSDAPPQPPAKRRKR
jgi:hypothetical protein